MGVRHRAYFRAQWGSAFGSFLVGLIIWSIPGQAQSSTALQQSQPNACQRTKPLEMRLAQLVPTPGFQAVQLLGQHDSIYVSDSVGVSSAQLDSVVPTATAQQFVLTLWLTAGGARRVAKLTGNHIGSRLAVLVGPHVISNAAIVQRIALRKRASIQVGVPVTGASKRWILNELRCSKRQSPAAAADR